MIACKLGFDTFSAIRRRKPKAPEISGERRELWILKCILVWQAYYQTFKLSFFFFLSLLFDLFPRKFALLNFRTFGDSVNLHIR